MSDYSDAFKTKMVEKMLPPNNVSVSTLSRETGVSTSALYTWRKLVCSTAGMTKKRADKRWTPAEKWRLLSTAESLNGDELGEFLRQEGLYESQLKQWRSEIIDFLGGSKKEKAKRSNEVKKIKALERELSRKEKALAEAAALLVLKKKVENFWGAGDDFTTNENEQ